MAHPGEEALTIEGAVDALSNYNFDTNEMEAPEEASDPIVEDEDEIVNEETAEEDLATDEPVEEASEEEEEVPAIDAPVSWDAEQKEIFATLPPEAQKIVVAREGERDKGFQAKATELAEQRRDFEEAQKQMNIERQTYAQTLATNIGEQLREPSLDLLRTNPDQYLHEKEAYDSQLGMVRQAQQQADYYGQQAQQQELTDKNNFFASRNKELSTALPEFMGDAQYRDGVLSYGKTLGYGDGELEMARTQDIVTIDKAMKYDALIAKKVGVGDKLKTVPKVVKPGAKDTGSKRTRRTKANMKAHHKKGDVHSAARLLEDMF